MAEIISNQFSTTVNRSTVPSISEDDLSTTINIYKKGVLLTAVRGTPTQNQYQVKITGATGCTAAVQGDNKTIKVLTVTSNTGRVDITINIENKETYVKSIPIGSITGTQVISTAMSEVKQTANKISWLVKGGTNSSNMQLTDELFNLVSNNITLTADHINLNGYVSNDDANWSIDIDGNMETENMNVEGNLSADTISCNVLNSPKYPATLDGNLELYVYSGNSDDDSELYNNASFQTLQGAINALPKFLNGKTVHITMVSDCTEDVYLRGFVGGAIRIYMNGKTLYGTLRSYVCSCSITVYGGTRTSTEGATGIIHPNVGFDMGKRCVSAGFDACQYVALYKIKVFGADNKPSDISSDYKVAVASSAGTGSVYCSDVAITNCAIGFRTNNMGCIHVAKSSGKASRYGFESTTGGQISIADDSQAGGTTANTSESSGGQVWYKSPTFDGNTTSTDTTTAPSTSTTKTMTIKSTYGDTYRSSVYNNWKKDGTVRQGDYGYGDCTGCWFFGTAFAELKGKTITKVQITITRQSGGNYAAVGLVVRTHDYSSRPSGAPTLSSSSYGTLSLATGATGPLTITNSDVLNGISNGTVKGFGIRTTYDSAHYAVCSGSVTVKITYTE